MKEIVDVLEECLHVLNKLTCKVYIYEGFTTNTYSLANKIERLLEEVNERSDI